MSSLIWHPSLMGRFFPNYDIGCLPRKALLALPPAHRQFKAHQDPGTLSTYHSLTSPDHWVISSNTIWSVSQSPCFNLGYFAWVRTCLLSWVCFLPFGFVKAWYPTTTVFSGSEPLPSPLTWWPAGDLCQSRFSEPLVLRPLPLESQVTRQLVALSLALLDKKSHWISFCLTNGNKPTKNSHSGTLYLDILQDIWNILSVTLVDMAWCSVPELTKR